MLTLSLPFILASSSPRRHELLQFLQIPFSICSVDTDEVSHEKRPETLVQDVARQKALMSAKQHQQPGLYLGADTLVILQDAILGKPSSPQEAYDMIHSIQNQTHRVLTGLCLFNSETKETILDYDCTHVHIVPMSNDEIQGYVAMGESFDKAGAYAIQGAFACYIDRIEGCYYNVMGLPLAKLYSILKTVSNQT